MESHNKNKRLNHGSHTPPKLSLVATSRTTMPPDAPTPPPRTVPVSVPFQWEEAPGKPRPCHASSESNNKGSDVARALELPPRLSTTNTKVSKTMSMPSPTTVLEGPYVMRATSFTTPFRNQKESWNANFVSSRWSGNNKNNGVESEGTFDFSSWTEDENGTVKITRIRRKGSFSQAKSQLWSSIYQSVKQVVPWRRRHERQRKSDNKI
ncbi:hypothetical protein HN51_016984 [Arachis hypogaea]|uniref:Uncharacterized protein n=2 Tax=Arachis TaxID=3817 RepID=A0A445CVG5_ARAHY|nr:uncharacterized protein At4g00950 [Arachis duranensis]XP_025659474.1 uncharacterized protein At4g00950 [Arachis hypogaea]QHO47623.1 uncharacterized protein DS421_6g197840 [Arachis hypogaea]QHO47624.1 uncharacterized protein DS421_6g197840 [Arachis hypogaea]RYR54920.1 hypothetical protein Ahy_A06g030180 [Arachis hypogaea]